MWKVSMTLGCRQTIYIRRTCPLQISLCFVAHRTAARLGVNYRHAGIDTVMSGNNSVCHRIRQDVWQDTLAQGRLARLCTVRLELDVSS